MVSNYRITFLKVCDKNNLKSQIKIGCLIWKKPQHIHIDIESSSKMEAFKQNQSVKEHMKTHEEQLSSVFNIVVRDTKRRKY